MSRLQLPKLMYINDSEEALLKCLNHFANLLKVIIGVSTPENSCMQKQNNFTTSFLLLLPPYCMQVIFYLARVFFFFIIPQPKDVYCTEDLFGSSEQIVFLFYYYYKTVPIQRSLFVSEHYYPRRF